MSSRETLNSKAQSLIAHYIAIWKLQGANNLPSEKDRVELVRLEKPTFIASVTCDPSPYLFQIDHARAVATQLLKGMFAPENYETLEERLAVEIELAKERRATDSKNAVFLVLEGRTDLQDAEFGERRDTDQFSICIDRGNKAKIRELFDPLVKSALAATSLSLASNVDHQIEKIGDVIYFTEPEAETESGAKKPIFAFTLRGGSARVSLSNPLTEEVTAGIEPRFSKLIADEKIARPVRLLVTSLRSSADQLQAFIAAWSALEIFVNASFKKTYEAYWFEILEDGAPVAAKPVFERFRDVMSDKYRLADKFLIMASVLDAEAATSDSDEFRKLKKVRDDLLHGLETPYQLPTEAVQKLLIKYMRLHLDQRTS